MRSNREKVRSTDPVEKIKFSGNPGLQLHRRPQRGGVRSTVDKIMYTRESARTKRERGALAGQLCVDYQLSH